MKLRQSHSAYLLGRGGRTLAELRKVIASGREPTKAMEDGALVDQLLYGGHTYCEAQTCTKRSGPDKGTTFEAEDWTSADAKEQREAARARGQVCALRHEIDTAQLQRQSMLDCLLDEGVDLVNKHTRMMGEQLVFLQEPLPGIYTQPHIEWLSAEGVECMGTLDILQVFPDLSWRVIDTKLSARADQEWMSKQVADMGWDVQARTYYEACVLGLGLSPDAYRGHGVCVCEKRSWLHMTAMHWLEDIFLHCGAIQWDLCKHRWAEAVKNNEWPGVIGGKLSPPGYYVTRICDSTDSAGADDLSSIGLDTSELETED